MQICGLETLLPLSTISYCIFSLEDKIKCFPPIYVIISIQWSPQSHHLGPAIDTFILNATVFQMQG